MLKDRKIYISGHNGMVGSAIWRNLESKGYTNLIGKSSKELDLRNQQAVADFFEREKPEYVFLAAAKVGGILANINSPSEFLYDNLMIQLNIIHHAYLTNVRKVLILGSSCVYPKYALQPMKESYLLTNSLEPTNEGYALSKIIGLKMSEFYSKQYNMDIISIIPPNLYGENDNFNLKTSHVLSALVKKFVDAKEKNINRVTLWGTGTARREFMHVDDIAEASYYFMKYYNHPSFINVGWGKDISIKELVSIIKEKVDYDGKILWDDTKPDGMLKKCMDVTKMKELKFMPKISLGEGIDIMIELYKNFKGDL
jgi:GDP-L-fucose synthase